MQKREKQIGIRIFFLALFLSYFAGITFFTHQHIVDGEVVVHSHFIKHPFAASSEQIPDHEHNVQTIHLIASISSWITKLTELTEIPRDFYIFISAKEFEYTYTLSSTYIDNLRLRGPPSYRI